MEKISRILYFLVCFVFFIFTNSFFTRIILRDISEGLYVPSNPVFSLTYVQNSGAAFNLFPDSREVLIIISVVALTLIFLHVFRHAQSLMMKSMFFIALLCAGISGNLHERIQLGYVRDFFKLNFVDFPVFNISDIYINIAVIALIILIIIKKTK